MKKTIGLLAALASLAMGTSALAQQKVVVHAWGGVWGDAMKTYWFEPFTKQTGIQVELVPQGSMMESLAKLKAQKDNMNIDVWVNGMTPTILADEAGLLAPIPRDQLTNAKDLAAGMIGDKYVASWNIFYGLVYNKDKVPFQIKSWNDLLDPRLKGQVGVPHATGYGGKFIALLSWLGGGSEKNIDPAFAYAQRLVPNIGVISKSDPEAINFLTSGEVNVVTMMPPGNFVKIKESGAQYVFVAPDPYVPTNFNNFALLKGPNTANGLKFIDFAIGKDAQEQFAAKMDVLPVNNRSAVPASLAGMVDRSKLRIPDEATLTKDLNGWAERWNKEIQAKIN